MGIGYLVDRQKARPDPVGARELTTFNTITALINGKDKQGERFGNYQKIAGDVLDGGNPYESMTEVLKRLGITAKGAKEYKDKFGITLAKRAAVGIDDGSPKQLTAAAPVAEMANADRMTTLLTQSREIMNLNEGEFDMWVADAPIQATEPPAIYMAANKNAIRPTGAPHKLGVCRVVRFLSQDVDPVLDANMYVGQYMRDSMSFIRSADGGRRTDINLQIIKQPQYGTLEQKYPEATNFHQYDYQYIPNQDKSGQGGDHYMGNDDFVMEVSAAGITVQIYYTMAVHVDEPTTYIDSDGTRRSYPFCPKESWKISLSPAPDYTSDIQPLLTYTGISGAVTVEVADLPGAALAQTTGESITFDNTAAGNGWFIDATPDDNAEYLPTSNPNQWIAKADSEAAGKMDLLSVLLHEYGHVLGIEHSPDGNDFMAATLQPGVRRLPSSEELALMAQLAGQARLALDGSGSPDAPNPALPLGTLGFALLGRLRRTEYGAWTVQAESASLLPQYQIAINPTLENGDLTDTTAWQTNGNIALAGNGSAVLGESATAQAHLAQGFTINPGDRTLSFTVDEDLEANGSNGPSDAFEVALLNANTGAALTGSDGLSQSDALLNIQTDGTEHTASSVHKVRNADGSTTYHIDLEQAINAGDLVTGTSALLSFDLIGFGGEQSHVTLRDIRLSRDPLALDDSITTDEDTPVTLSPLANDLLQTGETPALELTHQPAHGVLAQNLDGTLSYQPDANWNGTDSFSYRYSVTDPESGELVSNQATVTLAVTAINDAPTAPDGSATIMAGKPLVLDPLAGAFDVEGDTLVAQILTPPAHGTLEQSPDGTWTYIADITYFGDDAFTYQVSDGQAASAPVSVNLAATPANTAPVAHDGLLQMNEDGSLILLAGASGSAATPGGDALYGYDLAAFGLDAEAPGLAFFRPRSLGWMS